MVWIALAIIAIWVNCLTIYPKGAVSMPTGIRPIKMYRCGNVHYI